MLHSELYENLLPEDKTFKNFLARPVNFEIYFTLYVVLAETIVINQAQQGAEITHETSKNFLLKLSSLKSKENTEEINDRIDFVLIAHSARFIECYNMLGHFHYCYDIIMIGLCDRTYQNGEEFEFVPARIWKYLLNDDTLVEVFSEDVLSRWIANFYYYSRSFSGLNNIGNLLIDMVISFIEDCTVKDYSFAFLLSNVNSWCELNKLETYVLKLVSIIDELESKLSDSSDPLFRQTVRLSYLQSNRVSDSRKKIAAQSLLMEDWVNSISEVQYLTLVYTQNLVPSFDIQLLYSAISKMVQDLGDSNKIDLLHEKSRLAKIFTQLILHCFETDKHEILAKTIELFYGEDGTMSSTMFLIPNHSDGTRILTKEYSFLANHDAYLTIMELVESYNLALNQYILLKGIDYNHDYRSGEIGFPNFEYGHNFHQCLKKVYLFDKVDKRKLDHVENIFQIEYDYLPYQAIMIEILNSTAPRLTSFQHKLPFPEVKKILFWKGTSFTAEREFDYISEVFKSSKIKIEICDSSVEDFGEKLKEDYDIIWLSSHGDHNHYDPFNSTIHIGESSIINVSDLTYLNSHDRSRRLLFFNVCDGSSSAGTGELLNVGLPALLTLANQDYLSHLWPIDFNIAPIYGCLFAIYLADNNNYLDAYIKTIRTLLEGKESILIALKPFIQSEIISELSYSVENMSYDFSNILYWGSSAYYC